MERIGCTSPYVPSLSTIRRNQEACCASSASGVQTHTTTSPVPSATAVTQALHTTVAALRGTDVEMYVASGEPIRPLRMVQLYDRLIALHGAFSVISSSLDAIQHVQTQEVERWQATESQQWARQHGASAPTPSTTAPCTPRDDCGEHSADFGEATSCSPSSTPVPSAPLSPLLSTLTTGLAEIVQADPVLSQWCASMDDMEAIADLSLWLCRLLHREGREVGVVSGAAGAEADARNMSLERHTSGTDLDDDEGGGEANSTPRLSFWPDIDTITNKRRCVGTPNRREESVPWFTLTALLTKLLLIAGTCAATSADLRTALLPRWLQLISVVLSTHAVRGPLLDQMDPCGWLHPCGGHDGVCVDAPSITKATPTPTVSHFCFSSALRADGLQLVHTLLLTSTMTHAPTTNNHSPSAAAVSTSTALPTWQRNRLLGCVVAQLYAPATETRVYELAVWTLHEYAQSKREAADEDGSGDDCVTAAAVVNALRALLAREDTPSAALRLLSSSCQTPRPARALFSPDISPLPDSSLLVPSPMPSALQLPQYQQVKEEHRAANEADQTIAAQEEVAGADAAGMMGRGAVQGTVLASVNTAAVEVQRAPAARIACAASPHVSCREMVLDSHSAGRHRGEEGPLSGDPDGFSLSSLWSSPAPAATSPRPTLSSSSLSNWPHVVEVAPADAVHVHVTAEHAEAVRSWTSTPTPTAASRSASTTRAPTVSACPLGARDAHTVSEAVSSDTILREWYRLFQEPITRSLPWSSERGSYLTSTPSPDLHACVSSRPYREATTATMGTVRATVVSQSTSGDGSPNDHNRESHVQDDDAHQTCEAFSPVPLHSPTGPGLSPQMHAFHRPQMSENHSSTHTATRVATLVSPWSASEVEAITSAARASHQRGCPPFSPLTALDEGTGDVEERHKEATWVRPWVRCGEKELTVRRRPSYACATPRSLMAASTSDGSATLYPSHLALRVSVVHSLRVWCLPSSIDAQENEQLRPERARAANAKALSVLAQTRIIESVVATLQTSHSRPERAFRAALRHWLCEVLTWTTAALSHTTDDARGQCLFKDAAAIVALGETLMSCLPLLQGPTTAAAPASAPPRPLPGAAPRHSRGVGSSLEATEADDQTYLIVQSALVALSELLPRLAEVTAVSTTTANAPREPGRVQAFIQKLALLALQCVVCTSSAARSGAPAPRWRTPPLEAQRLAGRARPSASSGCAGYRCDDVSLKTAAQRAGELALSTLQGEATRLLALLCTCVPTVLRERALAPQYELILEVVMTLLRAQTTRLSSARALVSALASKVQPRRPRGTPALEASTSPFTPACLSQTGFSTAAELRALVNLLNVFVACASDMLRVHPYYAHHSSPTSTAVETSDWMDGTGCGVRGALYYHCLRLVSRARFLHTLVRLGSSATIATLTETAAQEVGEELGTVALNAMRDLFQLPGFSPEDRHALLTEANTRDEHDEGADADDADEPELTNNSRRSRRNTNSHEDPSVVERMPEDANAEPLFTLAAKLFRLLDLDTRCTPAMRTHVKLRVLRWVQCVFENCPPRSVNNDRAASENGVPRRLSVAPSSPRHMDARRADSVERITDMSLAMAILMHRGYLENLTADIERAAVFRGKSSLEAADTADSEGRRRRRRSLPAATLSTRRGTETTAQVSQRAIEGDCLQRTAQASLTMLLILLRHVPQETLEDDAARAALVTPISPAVRRRLVALPISAVALGAIRAVCGHLERSADAAQGRSQSTATTLRSTTHHTSLNGLLSSSPFPVLAVTRTRTQAHVALYLLRGQERDVLLELAVRVLYEWLGCVLGTDARVDGGSALGSVDAQNRSTANRSPLFVHSLHATDSVQLGGAASGSVPHPSATNMTTETNSGRVPRRRPAAEISATTQQDFSGASEEAGGVHDLGAYPFLFQHAASASSSATAPWIRCALQNRRTGTPSLPPASVRVGRAARYALPRRPTAAPTIVSIDHAMHSSAHERLTSSRVAPPRVMTGTMIGSGSVMRQLRSSDVNQLMLTSGIDGSGSVTASRLPPCAVMEAYLETHERYLPFPVADAFRGLLKSAKKRDG